jgi:DNA helicase-2/ATP-dependent DNA helicase PcrA
MVIAGPGTGKTQVLTLRIANILRQTDTPPDGILALTFTESGAKAMRERLRSYIGAAAYRVPIFTFHGFAQRLIAAYPDAYETVIGGRPVGDVEQIALIERVLESGAFRQLRPSGNPAFYVKPLRRTISDLKQENVTPDRLNTLIDEQERTLADIEQYHTKGAHVGKVRGEYRDLAKAIDKNRELAVFYRQYEALMRERQLYDFDDMILETVRALEQNEDMLRDLQERYLYLLADEHQDVNGAQNRILELLASYHDRPNIFAVGDEKQAIYRFQGASLENFLFFQQRFPDTKEIVLTENYRSGQPILDAAHDLVAVDSGPLQALRIPLHAQTDAETRIERRVFSHQAVEDDWVVETVQEAIGRGVSPEEVAVIVRTNREVEQLAGQLRKAGLAVAASAEGDVLRHPITQAIHSLLEVIGGEDREAALFTVLHGAYWGIDPTDLLRVLRARSYEQPLWAIIHSSEILADLGVADPAAIQAVGSVIATAREREVTDAPHRVLEYVLHESGLFAHIVQYDPLEGTRVMRRLYDEIEELVLRDGIGTVRDVVDALTLRRAYGLPLNAPFIVTNTAAVNVLTAHKAKGLEYEVVVVPHLVDTGWSGRQNREYFQLPHVGPVRRAVDHEPIEDEERLLYVAMTRAKHTLLMSSAETNADAKALTESRLLGEIEPALLPVVSTHDQEAAFDPVAALRASNAPVAIDTDLLRLTLQERGFSATSLNNYLTSPWNYFYRNVLRIPETQPTHMQYGTAVHNTLEFATRTHTDTGALPTDQAIKQRLETELRRLPISTTEYVQLLEQGLAELFPYLGHLAGSLGPRSQAEMNVRVVLPTGLPDLPELPLTGKLDRIDFDTDGRALQVVDYKTGKPKSRNAIAGNTKSDDGAYKRQLVFYALLLQLYDDERYQCRRGVLSFVRPTDRGDIKEEAFEVTDEEIAELRTTIIEAAREIMTGQFLTCACDDATSDYCHYVHLLTQLAVPSRGVS